MITIVPRTIYFKMTKSKKMKEEIHNDRMISDDIIQAGTGDEFLDELLSNDASLDEGAVPDIKVMDSSIAMSGNEVNASTLLDFFNHLGKSPTEVGGSSGGGRFGRTSDGVAVKEEPLSEEDLRLLQKDRQKKDNHNMIERRRRFNIDDRIKELGTLLPKQQDQYYDIVRDVRQNKGSILKASVEYIKKLKSDQHKKRLLEEKCRIQESQNRKLLLKLQEYEQQMKAYGIPVQSYVFKPASASVTSANGGSLIGTFVKAESITSNSGTSATLRTVTAIHTTGNSNGGINSREADSTHTASSVVSTVNVKQEMPDLEGCHLTSKQLEEFMDEDCHGPVTSGDPMLSSPHLSPHDVLPSPASSGSHYSNNDDALTPDSMDLAV